MPIIYNKDSIPTDQLQSLPWFADRVSDYVYDPGATQESLEENLSTLRTVYADNQLGGVFMEYMSRVRLAWRDADTFKRLGLYIRVPYTYDDFIYSEAPYQEIDAARTAFERGQITAQIEQQAIKVGIKPGRFRELNNSYSQSLYLIVIGLPSAVGNLLHRKIKFDYYKQPWEAWADKLGGVKR